jgi:hypothetical protein
LYQNIIWDVDGAQFNTCPAMTEGLGRVLAQYGTAADLGWLMELATQSVRSRGWDKVRACSSSLREVDSGVV